MLFFKRMQECYYTVHIQYNERMIKKICKSLRKYQRRFNRLLFKIAEKHQSEAAMLKTQLAEAKKNADEKDSIIAAYESGMDGN